MDSTEPESLQENQPTTKSTYPGNPKPRFHTPADDRLDGTEAHRLSVSTEDFSDLKEEYDIEEDWPEGLSDKCKKAAKDPMHHTKYLTLEELSYVCNSTNGTQDHEHADLIKQVGFDEWKKAADSVVLLSVTKGENGKKFYSTGFVIDFEAPEGCIAILMTNHNILKTGSDTDTVDPGDISVVFFRDDSNDSKCVTCEVTQITSMQSPPIRVPKTQNDRHHLDYAVLFVKVEEKIKELKQEINDNTDEARRKHVETQIHSLSNLKRFVLDSSVRLQLLQMSSAISYVQGLVMVCIGHPHGAPKKISFGSITSNTEELYNDWHPERTSVASKHTCGGSSGSPMFAFPKKSTNMYPMESLSQDPLRVSSLHVKGTLAVSCQSITAHAFETQKPSTFYYNCKAIIDILSFFNMNLPKEVWLGIKKYLVTMEDTFKDKFHRFVNSDPIIAFFTKSLYDFNLDPVEQNDHFKIIPIPFDKIQSYILSLQELQSEYRAYIDSPHDSSSHPLLQWYIYAKIDLLRISLDLQRETFKSKSIETLQEIGILVLLKICPLVNEAVIMQDVLGLIHMIVFWGDSGDASKKGMIKLGLPEKLCEILNFSPTPAIFFRSLTMLLFLYNHQLPNPVELCLQKAHEKVGALFDGGKDIFWVVLSISSYCSEFAEDIKKYISREDICRLTQALSLYADDFRVLFPILKIIEVVCWHSDDNKQAAIKAGIISILASLLKDKTCVENEAYLHNDLRTMDDTCKMYLHDELLTMESKIDFLKNGLQLNACILICMLTPGVLTTEQNVQHAAEMLEVKLLKPLVHVLDNGKNRHLFTCFIIPNIQFGSCSSIYFPDPVHMFLYKDGMIMTAIIKLMQAAEKLGTLDQACQDFLAAGGKDKIKSILQNGDDMHKYIASGLIKYLR